MTKINVDQTKLGPDRYQMDAIECRSQKNNKTYITNLPEIATSLNRTSEELLKFIGYSLSTQTNSSQIAINGVYTKEQLQTIMYDYISKFVLCPTCRNPETAIFLSKSKKMKIGCKACGASSELSTIDKFGKWLYASRTK